MDSINRRRPRRWGGLTRDGNRGHGRVPSVGPSRVRTTPNVVSFVVRRSWVGPPTDDMPPTFGPMVGLDAPDTDLHGEDHLDRDPVRECGSTLTVHRDLEGVSVTSPRRVHW